MIIGDGTSGVPAEIPPTPSTKSKKRKMIVDSVDAQDRPLKRGKIAHDASNIEGPPTARIPDRKIMCGVELRQTAMKSLTRPTAGEEERRLSSHPALAPMIKGIETDNWPVETWNDTAGEYDGERPLDAS